MRWRRRALRGDDGTTLVEQVVAMGVFTVLVALFMSAVVSMTGSTSRTQNRSDAADAVRAAFLQMDRQVRYASSVNLAGTGPSGDWYVEFRSPRRTVMNEYTCTQWRYDVVGGSLLMRSWTDGTTPTTTWSRVAPAAKRPGTPPFVVQQATPGQPFQQLRVRVTADSGRGATAGSASIDTTFVARNSSTSSPSNADADGNKLSDTPVCALGARS